MIYGLKRVARYLLGMDRAGRLLRVYPDDTFIVSYPRSGNTWTRFLIANLIRPTEDITFANIERIIPDAEAQSSRFLLRTPRPRIVKTHEYFDHRYKKIVYIVRDPRDVVISYYNFQRKYRQIEDAYPLAHYVRDFVNGRLISADWGTWGENVGSWLARAARPGFLLVRYEDLLLNPLQELGRLAGFLNVASNAELLNATLEKSSAQRMREMERAQSADWVTTKGRRQDIPFVGTASAGSWKTLLQRESVAEIESKWGSIMEKLGYTPAEQPLSGFSQQSFFPAVGSSSTPQGETTSLTTKLRV
jgi:hypothetical protein